MTRSQQLCQQLHMQALEFLCFSEVFLVLGLAGMDLTFTIADPIVLYFVFVDRTVLITHQRFVYC